MKVLLVAEGSGGHLIPALQVAKSLASAGAQARVWYAKREPIAPLVSALAEDSRRQAIEVDPIDVQGAGNWLGRLSRCQDLWSRAEACFKEFSPDVVVGFGGWISAPILLAARRHGIGCVVHEQNVLMGRANRLLSGLAQRVAISFPQTRLQAHRSQTVMTGMPIRSDLGLTSRIDAARRLGLSAERPTVLVLGGSQGSHVINQLMIQCVGRLTEGEVRQWQVVHITGAADVGRAREVYQAAGVAFWADAFLADMDAAYALSDVVLSRAGGSTIAELARCGKPAILIPFPYAGGHQRANARVVESAGAGIVIEESMATPQEVLAQLRRVLSDNRLRQFMSEHMRTLNHPNAAERLAEEIFQLAAMKT